MFRGHLSAQSIARSRVKGDNADLEPIDNWLITQGMVRMSPPPPLAPCPFILTCPPSLPPSTHLPHRHPHNDKLPPFPQ
ncbi:hypothetical protein JZ751_016922 [Albula glossodonta]|uniref:Uncharacterized protein n=1 Tax=Albula glossodonta TaxID=121402 RepID=A0A8T2MKB8_9TELE|nr:hypothetical protein JZ751_016922 [Albula glossodonta]